MLGLFLWIESRVTEPILPLHFFRNSIFATITIVGFLMGAGMFGAIMFIPLFVQGVMGISATAAGSVMIPMMLGMMCTSVLGGSYLTKRLSIYRQLIWSMSIMGFGFYLLSTMGVGTSVVRLAIYMTITGLGMGVIMPVLTTAVQGAFTQQDRGTVTSATQFFRSIGGTLGVAVLGAVMNDRSTLAVQENLAKATLQVPEIFRMMMNQLGGLSGQNAQATFSFLLRPDLAATLPSPIREVVIGALQLALAQSLHIVFLTACAVMLVGAATAWYMGSLAAEQETIGEVVAKEA
jgi:hypothetical protein